MTLPAAGVELSGNGSDPGRHGRSGMSGHLWSGRRGERVAVPEGEE